MNADFDQLHHYPGPGSASVSSAASAPSPVPTAAAAAAAFPAETTPPGNQAAQNCNAAGSNNDNRSVNSNNNNHETVEELRDQARTQCREAVRVIPLVESQACLEAMKKAPRLFEENMESDPLKFMLRENNDPWAAAKRLCLYWKERKELFGEERAFLPLTVTGDGALKREDIMCVEAGVPAILPDRAPNGQTIMWLDRRQKPPSNDDGERMRSVFYVFSVAAEEERAQTDGILCLFLMTTPRSAPTGPEESFKKGLSILLHAMPVRFMVLALNFPPQNNANMYVTQAIISSLIKWGVSVGFSLENQVDILFERERGEIGGYLQEKLGMQTSSIPVIAGGTWQFLECQRWCKRRAKIDRERHGELAAGGAVTGVEPVKGPTDSGNPTKQPAKAKRTRAKRPAKKTTTKAAVAKPNHEKEEETRLFKKRAANVVHSRRKRERRAKELQDMSGERTRLTRENNRLKSEAVRLEELLRRAQELATDLDDPARRLSLLAFSRQSLSQPQAQMTQAQDPWEPLPLENAAAFTPLPFRVSAVLDPQQLALFEDLWQE